MEQPVVRPPEQMQNYWRKEVISRHPEMVQTYLERNNLKELPLPEYVTPDQGIFYREINGEWETLKYPAQTHGLVTAVEKNWLMARPKQLETLEADSTVATGKSDLEVGLEQLSDNLKKRDTRQQSKIEKPFKCSKCTRRFKSEAGVKVHINARHREEN